MRVNTAVFVLNGRQGEEVDDFGVTSKKQVCKIAYGNKLSSILYITNTYGYMC